MYRVMAPPSGLPRVNHALSLSQSPTAHRAYVVCVRVSSPRPYIDPGLGSHSSEGVSIGWLPTSLALAAACVWNVTNTITRRSSRACVFVFASLCIVQ